MQLYAVRRLPNSFPTNFFYFFFPVKTARGFKEKGKIHEGARGGKLANLSMQLEWQLLLQMDDDPVFVRGSPKPP